MATIPLTQDKHAIVDDEDFERVSKFKWSYNSRGYAFRNAYLGGGRKNPIRKTVHLHRFIMDTPKGMDTDHINGNSLDCRKKNLRICTHKQNTQNKYKHHPSKSGFKGVHLDPRIKKKPYQSVIRLDGHTKSLGYYETAVQAAQAYDKAAVKFFGRFAHLNGVTK